MNLATLFGLPGKPALVTGGTSGIELAVSEALAAAGAQLLAASDREADCIGPYAMSKAALAQVARNLAVELGPDNIRANAFAPGLIETPF